MAEYISDDEEFEQFKRWWRESGQQLLLIIVVAVVGYFGWQFWKNHQLEKAGNGYTAFVEMQEAAQIDPGQEYNETQKQTLIHLATTIKDDYAGSQYAYYASLLLAKLAYQSGDAELAIKELTGVMNEADEALSLIARIRLAKIEADQNGADAGLTRLGDFEGAGFSADMAELRGDLYWQKGERDMAAAEYNKALQSLGPHEQQFRSLLAAKINMISKGSEPQGTDVTNGIDTSMPLPLSEETKP